MSDRGEIPPLSGEAIDLSDASRGAASILGDGVGKESIENGKLGECDRHG